MSRTCESSGHQCGLISLLHLGLITKEQYECLMNLPGFCVPGIGTNPSKILDLLNGEINDCPGKPIIPGSNQKWLLFDCTKYEEIAKRKVTEAILDDFMGIVGPYNSLVPRLVLHLTIGKILTDTRGHYVMYDKGNITDPFDPRLNIWLIGPTEIAFSDLNLRPIIDAKEQYILFLVDDNELIGADKKLIIAATNPTPDAVCRVVDTDYCRQLEGPIMDAFSKASACSKTTYTYVGFTQEEVEELEQSAKRRRSSGGKTNTKKKYRAKTLLSTNKYAKRHRIRRSRRKSQGNRINNGKH